VPVRQVAHGRRSPLVEAAPPICKDSFLMTAQTVSTRGWRSVSPVDVILGVILAFVLLAGFKGAFQHMHDWTVHELDDSAQGWVNAIISELMPTASFLLIQKARSQNREINGPMALFWVSALLSLVANLTATRWYPPGGKYLLAILPMLAVLILGEMILRDVVRSSKAKAARLAERELAAELARNQAARAAELEAERTRNFEREQAELAAELRRRDAEHAAELARQQAEREAATALEIERVRQAEITRREQLAAQERAEQRRIADARERREAEAREAREAEAARIVAEAEAERIAAETERIRVATAAQEQAAALLAGRHRAGQVAEPATGRGNVSPIRQRRPRFETQAIADAALAMLPAGTSRDEAVKAVAAAIGNTERYARDFVPAGWTAGSSAGGEVGAA
jgi:hypothetical protein